MTEEIKLATLEELLAVSPRRYKIVTLPVSAMKVRIRSLTEKEISDYQMAAMSKAAPNSYSRSRLEDAGRRLVCLCLVDMEGRLLLNETHADALAKWDGADFGFLYEECSIHCGINRRDIEELVKNSKETSVDA